MITDKLTDFSQNERIEGDANVEINFDKTFGTLGYGSNPAWLYIAVTEDFTVLTSITWALQYSADGSTYVTLMSWPSVARADLIAGRVIVNQVLPVVEGLIKAKRLRLTRTVAGSDATAGRVSEKLNIGGVGIPGLVQGVVYPT